MARKTGRICPDCQGPKSYYAITCWGCRDWSQQPNGTTTSRLPEDKRERARLYYIANRDKKIAQAMAWQAGNSSYRETKRQWREANREKIQADRRAWMQANVEKRRACDLARRARKKGADAEVFDRADIIARDRSICHICGTRVSASEMTLDHLIPLSQGGAHTRANVAVAHRSCNSRMGAGRLPAQLRLVG